MLIQSRCCLNRSASRPRILALESANWLKKPWQFGRWTVGSLKMQRNDNEVTECISHQGGQYIQNEQWHTIVNISRLAVGYLNATMTSTTRNVKPGIGPDGFGQTWQNPWVDRYGAWFGPPRCSGSGFWTVLECNRTVYPVQTRTRCDTIEEKPRSMMKCQNCLKHIRQSPLHWDMAVAEILATFEDWLLMDSFNSAEWIPVQWFGLWLKICASEIQEASKTLRQGNKRPATDFGKCTCKLLMTNLPELPNTMLTVMIWWVANGRDIVLAPKHL